MKAMLLRAIRDLTECQTPLVAAELPVPEPGPQDVLLRVTACGVCHTELDEIEGRTPPPVLPMIPGHQVVGRVEARGQDVRDIDLGDRLGVGWVFSTCGKCTFCRQGDENLCPEFQATGRDANGGYAEYMVMPAAFTHPLPDAFSDTEIAPFLCAGAIGYRSLSLTQLTNGRPLGLSGFGASGHLVLKLVQHLCPDSAVHVFARSAEQREFALQLGAEWAGETAAPPPCKLSAIIDTTPAWKPVVEALRNLAPGGRLVINAIRKEDRDKHELARLDYPTHLWMEKEIKSVANVSRRDIREFLSLAADMDIRPEVTTYDLSQANEALVALKRGGGHGARVLTMT